MEKQILLPLDGSALAESVLPHAAAMARLTESDLFLMQAVAEPGQLDPTIASVAPAVDTYDVWVEELNDARSYMAAVTCNPHLQGITVHTEIVQEQAAIAIVDCLESHPNVIMTAMSTHGRSGIGRWIFGSVTERVLHAATKPVLVVRPSPKAADGHPGKAIEPVVSYKNILVPLDGSHFAEEALGWAKGFAATTGAALQLVSVVSERRRGPSYEEGAGPRWTEASLAAGVDNMTHYLTATREHLKAEGFEVHTQVLRGPAADMILAAAEVAHADLVVMSTHGRSGWQRLWPGSVAMKVVQQAKQPVLLIRPRVDSDR